MWSQVNLFDICECSSDIPSPDEKGCISSELLKPIRWEAWRFSRTDWTMNNGCPYIITALLAVLPGNRLYVKEWMMYPFMYEFASSDELEKVYNAKRKKIVERIQHNNNIQNTCQINVLPSMEDMYRYKNGEYSCKEYADKVLYGYGIRM